MSLKFVVPVETSQQKMACLLEQAARQSVTLIIFVARKVALTSQHLGLFLSSMLPEKEKSVAQKTYMKNRCSSQLSLEREKDSNCSFGQVPSSVQGTSLISPCFSAH
jgi:hypothetical protein